VVNEQNRVLRIVEQADANESEKRIKLINTGIYCVNRSALENLVGMIKSDNAQNEMYLTDIISIAADHAFKMGMIECATTMKYLESIHRKIWKGRRLLLRTMKSLDFQRFESYIRMEVR
jgi:bifunctional N-acetylglucosamine-1-phosphate-uridyltransferase/glucosamine-1-phosphate-acetyltransferase GlmU-like protein